MKHPEAFVYGSCHFLASQQNAYGIVITSNGVSEYENARTFKATDYCALDLLGLIDALEQCHLYVAMTVYTARTVVNILRNSGTQEKWKEMALGM